MKFFLCLGLLSRSRSEAATLDSEFEVLEGDAKAFAAALLDFHPKVPTVHQPSAINPRCSRHYVNPSALVSTRPAIFTDAMLRRLRRRRPK